MSANEFDKEYLVEFGAVVVTVLMASGRWDFFDIVVTALIIGFLLVFHEYRSASKKKDVFSSLTMGVVTTVLVVAVCSNIALSFRMITLAKLDFDTYQMFVHQISQSTEKVRYPDIYRTQLICKLVIFIVSSFVWFLYFRLKSRQSI